MIERFFDHSVDLLCIADAEGRFVRLNSAWERVLGWPTESLLGRAFLDFVHPDDVSATHAALSNLVAGHSVAGHVNRYRHKDGGWRSLEWSATLPPSHGVVFGAARDVTEALVERQRRARIEAASGIGTWEADLHTGRVFWSAQTHAIHGTDPATFVPDLASVRAFLDPESLKQLDQCRRTLAADGGAVECEVAIRTAQGDASLLRVTMTMDGKFPEADRLYGIMEDITERRAAEAARQREGTRHRLAQSVAKVGIAEFEASTGLVWWDSVCSQLIGGLPAAQTVSLAEWRKHVHPEDLPSSMGLLERLLKEGGRFDHTLRYRQAGGGWVSLRAQGDITERDGAGRPGRIVAIVQDVTAEQRNAAEIAAARDRLDALLNASPAVVYALGPASLAPTFVSASCERMLGETAAHIMATPEWWERHLHPDDAPLVIDSERAWRAAGAVGTHRQIYRIRRSDGDIRWVEDSCRMLRYPGGKPREVVGALVDITARKAQEAEISGARQRLQAMLDAIPDLLLELDADGRFVSYHSGLTDMLHVEPEAFIGKLQEDVLPPPVAAVCRAVIADVDATGRSSGRQYAIEIGGSRRWFEVSAARIRGRDGRPGYLMVTRDINDRLGAEEAVRHSEALLRGLFELSPIGILLSELDTGRIRDANPAMLRALRVDREVVLGMTHYDLSPPEERATAEAHLDDLRAAGRFGPDEKENLRPDGTRYPVRLSGVVLRDPSGVDLVWSLAEDITREREAAAEREAARRALKEEAERAEQANLAKTRFLASMSHEIRTPMNGVLGMAEVLGTALTDPEHRRMLGVIRESGEMLLTILNDILDVSKIEAGRLTLEAVPFVPADLARKAESLHSLKAGEKSLAFSVLTSIGEDQPRLGDPHRILQILHNLLGNAIKFTPTGSVQLALGCRPSEPLTITVTDTGIGMTPEQCATVFEDFVQADSTMTRRFGGTGLGMGIVRRLVDLMQGTITVESELGKGTTVSVSLPLPPASPAPVETAIVAQPDPAHLSGLRVLAADDNEINRIVLSAMLDALGVSVTMVPGGREAVAACELECFDALLLDISMPDLDGIGALYAIRAAEAARGMAPVPAIAVTANALSHQIAEYAAAGFAAHVAKPIRPEALSAALLAVGARTGP